MQNSKIFRLVFLVIVFILYSALVFSGLFTVQSSFLASYLFAIFAFIYVFSLWIMDRNNSCSICGGKISVTPFCTGLFYLSVTLALSILSGVFPGFPMAALVVINLITLSLVTGLTVMMFQRTDGEEKEEKAVEVRAGDGKLLQQMRSEINQIADSRESLEERRRLQRIAERLRIASPVSTEEIDCIDQAMREEIEAFMRDGDVMKLTNSLDADLDERKRLEQSLGV